MSSAPLPWTLVPCENRGARNRLEQFRRVATRRGERAANYPGMTTLATILPWL